MSEASSLEYTRKQKTTITMSRTEIARNLYRFSAKPKSPADRIIEMYTTKRSARLPHHQKLNEKELDDIHKLFRHFDKNGDYHLSMKEYNNFVDWSTGNTIRFPVTEIFRSIDSDQNSKISLAEFIEYAARRKTSLPVKSDLMKLFDKHDRDEDGHLDLEETRLAVLELGDQPNESGFARAFARLDGDNDGLLDPDEFISFVHSQSVRARAK